MNATDLPEDEWEPVEMSQSCLLYELITSTVIVGALCILGIIGNCLAFVVFCKDSVKTSASFLFQGLSVIDTALLVTALPLYPLKALVKYTHWWPGFEDVYPYVLVYILPCAFIAQTATIWVTVLVAVNRYIAVCMPYRASRLCTVLKARRQLAVVLLLSFLYNVPKLLEGRVVRFLVNSTEHNGTEWKTQATYTTFADHNLYHIIYGNIFYLVFLLIIPLFILTVLNVRLIKSLNRIRRRRMEMLSARQQADNNATFVLIVVVLVFTICQVPALVNLVLWSVLKNRARECGGFQFYLSRISNMLVILNSAINFVIYFFFNTRFRHVLVEVVCHRILRRNSSLASSASTTLLPKASETAVMATSANCSSNSNCITFKADDSLQDTFL